MGLRVRVRVGVRVREYRHVRCMMQAPPGAPAVDQILLLTCYFLLVACHLVLPTWGACSGRVEQRAQPTAATAKGPGEGKQGGGGLVRLKAPGEGKQ